MPRVVRINSKSGVSPKPRQVVPLKLTSYEQAELAKIPTGFQDPKMAPKGSSPNPPAKVPKTIAERIALSAKEPENRDKKPAKSEEEVWKRHIADVRRSYFKSSLLAYEEQEEKQMKLREQRRKAADEARDVKSSEVSETLAESLTTPTIESSLQHEFVIARTEEEKAELSSKRDFNRKLTARNNLSRQQEHLLQLYQDSSSYIVTEEQLEEKLQHSFKPEISVPRIGAGLTQNPVWWKYINNDASRVNSTREQSREAQSLDALEGKVRTTSQVDQGTERSMPGLKSVRSASNEDKTE